MKTRLARFTLLPIALLVCAAALRAAEIAVVAPESPVLRFALGKLEGSLQQQGDTVRRTTAQAPGQSASIFVAVDPAAMTDLGAEGFRRVTSARGVTITAGGERGAMYGVLDAKRYINIADYVKAGGVAGPGVFSPPALAVQLERDGAEALQRVAAVRAKAKPSPTLERALGHWERLAVLGGKFNQLPVLSSAREPFSWAALTPAVKKDLELARKPLGAR